MYAWFAGLMLTLGGAAIGNAWVSAIGLVIIVLSLALNPEPPADSGWHTNNDHFTRERGEWDD